MSGTYYGTVSVHENSTSLGDFDESNFYAQGNLTLTLNLSFDSSGNITGTATASGQYSGYAVGESDGDDDGFSDYASGAPLTVYGSLSSGLTIYGLLGSSGNFNYQGTFSPDGTTVSGTASLSDQTNGGTVSGSMSLSGSAPAAVPVLISLAMLAGDAYNTPPAGIGGWTAAAPIATTLGQIVNYTNADRSQVVIAVEGTQLSNGQDDLTDISSFPSGTPTAALTAYVAALAADIQQVLAANPNATITLTGHSLGGAVAQMVGEYTGFATTTFNAPGAQVLYTSTAVQNALSVLKSDVAATTSPNVNYRTQGDVVSLIGAPIGNTQTIVPPGSSADSVWNVLSNHSINTTIANLQNPASTITNGSVEPNANIQGLANALYSSGQTVVTPVSATVQTVTSKISPTVDFLGNEFSAWIDPTTAPVHVFAVNPGSPLISAVTFEGDANFLTYDVWAKTASGWSAPQTVVAGEKASFAQATTAIMYEGLSNTGQPVASGGSSLFYAQFSGAGTVSGTLTAEAACYRSGTRLLTARGPLAVEQLRIGDMLPTANGAGLLPVIWIGRRRIDCRRHPAPHRVWPVRVRAGAFGDGMPARDLHLSPDHAIWLWRRLVPIRCLINGITVRQEPVASVTYYHVELPRHAAILAEGLPAESYLDLGNRGAFANGGGAVALHPDFARSLWQAEGCGELILGGPLLAAARARLAVQAAMLGHATTDAPALRLAAGGATLAPQMAGGAARFTLPPGDRPLRLRSRRAIPGSTTPEREEAGRFGVAVTALLLDRQSVALDDPRLGQGWHDAAEGRRWTDGDAELHSGGARELIVRFSPGRYWAAPARPAARNAAAGR